MTTPQRPVPTPTEPPADLTFVAHDLGRDEAERTTVDPAPQPFVPAPQATPSAPAARFHVVGSEREPERRPAADELPWTTRGGTPTPAGRPGNSPWTVRRTEQRARTSATTVRRLRQEAVNLSWTAAWLAITASGSAGKRRRR